MNDLRLRTGSFCAAACLVVACSATDDAPGGRPASTSNTGGAAAGAGTMADLPKVLVHGPPKLISLNQWPASRPFVVLSPQHSGPPTCPTATELHDFFTFALGAYAIDTTRVYLTGLSCGAQG